MGYCHYFHYNDRRPTEHELGKAKIIFRKFATEDLFRPLVYDLPDDKDDWSGLKMGHVWVKLNGYSSKSNSQHNIDLSHEPLNFRISFMEGSQRESCKTNHKPYDIVVVCILKAMLTFKLIKDVSTDGDFSFDESILSIVPKAMSGHRDSQWREHGLPMPQWHRIVDAYESAFTRAQTTIRKGVSALPFDEKDGVVFIAGGRDFYF